MFALLVGIDEYLAVDDLRGCVNDIADVRQFLSARIGAGTDLEIRELLDGEATRAAVIDGIRSHLGRAGAGDQALLWFSGHGSVAPLPRDIWFMESDRQMQTLVCADSRHEDTPDLYDKELWLLLGDIARQGGRPVAILDSCHSGGAARDPEMRARSAPPWDRPPPLDLLIPELVARTLATGSAAVPDFVSLAACRDRERAHEMALGGAQRGLFTWSLLQALRRLGPDANYRQLLTAARCDVEQQTNWQVPQLAPVAGPLADSAFLGTALSRQPAVVQMRANRGAWELNVGACHGLADVPGDATQVAVHGRTPLREARITQVQAERSIVEPIGWTPDPDRQYPMVLSAVALPVTRVRLGEPGSDSATVARVSAAIAASGPEGRPSPHLRPLPATLPGIPDLPATSPDVPHLIVVAPRPGLVKVLDADGRQLVADIWDMDGRGAREAVRVMEQIARWRLVKTLTNPVSGLAGTISVELVPARDGQAPELHQPALRPDASGAIALTYRQDGGRWIAPTVHIRLRNTGSRRLFCALLDLTDQYGIHADLFDGHDIDAGGVGSALHGKPVEFRLPDDRRLQPGASAADWLLLVAAEREFSVEPFELAGFGDPPLTGARRYARTGGILDRIGGGSTRVAIPADDGQDGYDWSTTLIPVVTRVP